MRTRNNGELRIDHIDETVTLVGWVAKKCNLDKKVFIDLRDRYGITQVVFDEHFHDVLKPIENESVIQITGKVMTRVENMRVFRQGLLKC